MFRPPCLLGIGTVPWFLRTLSFRKTPGSLERTSVSCFLFLEAAISDLPDRLLDPTLQALSPGWSGNGDAGSGGGGKNPTGASILISRPTLSPITSTWYSSLAPVTFCLCRSPDSHLPSGSPQDPQTRRLSHGCFREPCSREVLPFSHLPNQFSFLPGALAPPPLFACV